MSRRIINLSIVPTIYFDIQDEEGNLTECLITREETGELTFVTSLSVHTVSLISMDNESENELLIREVIGDDAFSITAAKAIKALYNTKKDIMMSYGIR